MEVSSSKNCGECTRDFKAGEVVYVSWISEYPLCGSCRSKMTLINDWENRIIPKEKKNKGGGNIED